MSVKMEDVHTTSGPPPPEEDDDQLIKCDDDNDGPDPLIKHELDEEPRQLGIDLGDHTYHSV
jgi:hypothetical protein